METKLESVSPLSFEVTQVGDSLLLKKVKPKPGEFRGTIGAAVTGYLAFKGQTKIGMLPRSFASQHSSYLERVRSAKITAVDPAAKTIVVSV